MTIHPPVWTKELSARYELLEEAGRGGMGVVYKAKDRETGEIVALKILKPEIAVDPIASERFINEVRLSRRITHKNVCRIYEFSRAGSTAYVSMEFVEGESLRAIVERMGAVGPRKGVQIARQICSALHEAHTQGIIHRDLKPENVMIDRSGNVKVMDFGIARLLDTSATVTGSGIIGTPAYMAPEQAEGKTVDARTDIYALGLILYEIFTGTAAFSGDTPMVVALKQIRETPVAPRSLESTIPWELEATILRCLEKDPAERFQSVDELDAALASVSSGAITDAFTRSEGGSHQTDSPGGGQKETWPTVARTRTTPIGDRVPRLPRRSRRAVVTVVVTAIASAVFSVWFNFGRSSDVVPFTAFTLKNGLRVVVSEDHSAPTVSVVVTYAVGSRDERQGRRGFAHLFEHTMFSGSLNVGKGEHLALITNYGGVPNGRAGYDTTQFWQTLPSNQLDLALFLEADRMRSLKLEEARLGAERGTVIAEIEQNVENQPYGKVGNTLYANAFDTPGYQRDSLGAIDDVRAATLAEITDFFKIYYAPNNAVLSIVGDVDTADAKKRVEKYFEHIAAQPPPPVPNLDEPAQTVERRVTLDDPFAPARRLYIAYKAPRGDSDDWEGLQLLTRIIGDGPSSRLQQKLVKEEETALLAAARVDRRAGPGLLVFLVNPAATRDDNAVMARFDAIMQEIVTGGVTEAELTRARRRIELESAMLMQATLDRARLVGDYASNYGDADLVNEVPRRLAAVTVDDIRRLAAEYLRPERRTILFVIPARGVAPARPTFSSAATPPTSVSGERLNRAPVSKDVLRVELPKPREFQMENGLSVAVANVARGPLVSLRFEIRGAGPLYDPPALAGLSFAASAMLAEGSTSRSSRDIAQQLDALGATFTPVQSSDPRVATIIATGLSETFDEWFPIAAELVTQPSYAADELTRMKRLLASELVGRLAAAPFAARELYARVMYGAAAAPVPTAETITAITSDHVKAWHRERYAPQNTVLTIVGDLELNEVERAVRATLGGWQRTAFVEAFPGVTPPATRASHVIDRPGSVQTSLVMGGQAVDRASSDYLPLVVANGVLGGSPASRLFVKLREERGYSYNAGSTIVANKDGGDWRIAADVTGGKIADAMPVFIDEVRRISAEPIPPQELDDVKRSIVARFALTLEQLTQLGAYMGIRRTQGLSADYWDRFPDKILAITAEDAQRAAAKYMDVSKLQIIVVGDAAQLVPMLKPLGDVTVVK